MQYHHQKSKKAFKLNVDLFFAIVLRVQPSLQRFIELLLLF